MSSALVITDFGQAVNKALYTAYWVLNAIVFISSIFVFRATLWMTISRSLFQVL